MVLEEMRDLTNGNRWVKKTQVWESFSENETTEGKKWEKIYLMNLVTLESPLDYKEIN